MQTQIISQGNLQQRIEHSVENIVDLMGIKLDASSTGDVADFQSNSDIHIIKKEEKKKNISIDQAREMIRQIHIKPVVNDFTVIWIQEAQALSIEAQNALLKVIEEPPKYALILLSVDHEENLLSTIRSRCIVKKLSPNLSSEKFDEIMVEEFYELLLTNYGKRIDWSVENKDNFKDKVWALLLLQSWEYGMRSIMLKNADKKIKISQAEAISFIKEIQKSRINIENINANTSLTIENLLLHFPMW